MADMDEGPSYLGGDGGRQRTAAHEPHRCAAMESNEQLAYEELRWFDTYVEHAPPRGKAVESKAPAAANP